jgi:hypothetical protein
MVQPTVAAHQTGGAAGHGRVGHIHALHELALTEVAVPAFRTAWPNCSMPVTLSKRLHSGLSLASKSIVIQLPRTNTLVANSGGSAGKDQKQLNHNTPNNQF